MIYFGEYIYITRILIDPKAKAPKPVAEEKTDPLVVYEKLRKLGMSDDKIIKKMEKNGCSKDLIDKFKKSKSIPKDKSGNKIVSYQEKYKKFLKMKKMGMNEFTIINKMKMDGLSKEEMNDFKLGPDAYKKKMEQNKAKPNVPSYEEKFKKFLKMKKMGMNSFTITNKMKLDGMSKDDMKEFDDGPDAYKKKYSGGNNGKIKIIPYEDKYKKFIKMKKMGMNEFTIWNKMKLDGMNEEDLKLFKAGPDAYKKAMNKQAPTITFEEKFKKYIKMKKMGMPQNTVTNKMKLDGFDKNDIKLFFEGKAAWEKVMFLRLI